MSNPYEPPTSENPFRDQPLDLPPVQSSGMVNQVQVVCILMIVQGVLASLMGLFYVGYGIFLPVLFSMMEEVEPSDPPPAIMSWFMLGIMLAIGIPVLLSGILQIVAGIRNLKFRGRMLGIIAIIGGGVSVITCYCAPTGIALLVYGLIVYLNSEVLQAFEMGEAGASREQIMATFWPYRHAPPAPETPGK